MKEKQKENLRFLFADDDSHILKIVPKIALSTVRLSKVLFFMIHTHVLWLCLCLITKVHPNHVSVCFGR